MGQTKGEKKKRRLHFGVVVPSPDNTHKYELLDGIIKFCERSDIHLTAYFGSYVTSNIEFASHYEPCFEAIRSSSSLDGVIVYSGFVAHNMGYDDFKRCIEAVPKTIPLVSIGMQFPGFMSVLVDNVNGTYMAVEHLIKVHNRREIAFVKGPDGHPEAELRLSGYKKALRDNGIDLDESLIFPGNFTPACGRNAVSQLLDVRKRPFDAIATCNDEEAAGVLEELRWRKKISVPKDVSVVGFDDVEEAARTLPPLSTMKQDFSEHGVVAAKMLVDIISGKSVEQNKLVSPNFIARQSCGCAKTRRKRSGYFHDMTVTSDSLRLKTITERIIMLFDLDALDDQLYTALPQLSIETALLGLYKTQIASDRPDGDRTIDTLIGYDGERRFYIKSNSRKPIRFSDYSSIDNFDYDSHRRTLFFLPLFFADEEAGIAVMSHSNAYPLVSYEGLKRTICAAVRGARLLSKVEMLSVTDELTGLYNRRGLFQQVYSRLLLLNRELNSIPIVLVMDMDGLKKINDTYGHSEGDIAIAAFANILLASLRETDIIGRIGGDEFAAFAMIKSEDNIENLVSRIRQKFDEYNAKGHHPYKVMGSIGGVVLNEPTKKSFNAALQSADAVLYEEKMAKKKQGLTR